MSTFTKVKLSGAGDSNGPIIDTFPAYLLEPVVHETGTSSSILDEVWFWITNPSLNEYLVDVIVNDVYFMKEKVYPSSTWLALPGIPFSGDGENVTTIKFRALDGILGSECYGFGYVNRIVQ
jgi:hypothetical protein